ncbi:THUMP-like domain-containing protein [Telluribacter sp. SYSU D00476]|uniref:THUMP-like domain-containing protein n=1 Tax=Telluribacter sp. SYSU D00476 TaxID=2811430 RepID=UPI001FF3DC03|nr:hypothetical protein [Telluribacter sp. SYSU D00476]
MVSTPTPDNSNATGLTAAERTFVREHIQDDVATLLLKHRSSPNLDIQKVVKQIAARQKARYKLPEWYLNEQLLFPPPLSVEQGSSQATARYKAGLVVGGHLAGGHLAGRHLIDITGGMGVDCYYMSQSFEQTTYFEQQPEVARSAAYNLQVLGADHITIRNEEALSALSQHPIPADWIYADPARRDEQQRKVVRLADCTPDIVTALPLLQRCAPRLLVKTSPLLDIDLSVKELQGVQEVHVIGLESECKEVLYLITTDTPATHEPILKVRILNADGSTLAGFDFTRPDEARAEVQLGEPMKYLYEPHATLLKAGAFRSVASRFGLIKIAPSSHLYTSDEWLPDFPGRGFAVVAVCKPDARELHAYLPEGKANLTLRNFPATIQDLRKKWKIREGGDRYLFATTLADGRKLVVVTQKPPLS